MDLNRDFEMEEGREHSRPDTRALSRETRGDGGEEEQKVRDTSNRPKNMLFQSRNKPQQPDGSTIRTHDSEKNTNPQFHLETRQLPNLEGKTFPEKVKIMEKESQIRLVLAGEEVNKRVKEICRLERKSTRTAEEEEHIRVLKAEADRYRDQVEKYREFNENMSTGEKILRAHMSAKLTQLLMSSLAFSMSSNMLIHTASEVLDKYGGRQAVIDRDNEKIRASIIDGNLRADLIQSFLDTFIHMSDSGIAQGFINPEQPLVNDHDANLLMDLIEISRDTKNPRQAELYAEVCGELGLDPEKARGAFIADKMPFRKPHSLEKDLIPELAKQAIEISHTIG